MNEKKNVKASITLNELIFLILLVLGFFILLAFLYSFEWKQTADDETCSNSVIYRATAPGLTKNYIPLKCRTNKFCITDGSSGKGDCIQDFGEVSGVSNVRVSEIMDIEKFFADEILRCWNMMGEGKVSLFTSGTQVFGIGEVYPSCVICDRIAFDKNLGLDLTKVNVKEYMAKYKVPGKEVSYLSYLGAEHGLVTLRQNLFVEDLNTASVTPDALGGDIGTPVDPVALSQTAEELRKESAILFMQITAPGYWQALRNTLGIGLAGTFVVGAPVVAKVCASGGWWCAGIAALGIAIQQGSVAYNREVTAGYCGDATAYDSRSGCSVVRTVNYEPADIASYCKNIESIV